MNKMNEMNEMNEKKWPFDNDCQESESGLSFKTFQIKQCFFFSWPFYLKCQINDANQKYENPNKENYP